LAPAAATSDRHQGSPAKLRSWRVAILRNRSHYLGDVQAPDEASAEAAAVVEFKLSEDQRKRVVVQERDQPATRASDGPQRHPQSVWPGFGQFDHS
jgi:hypothetical protein